MYKILTSVALLASVSSLQAEVTTAHAVEEKQTNLSQFEAYLNNMTTLKGDFIQATGNGAISSGELHLSRPGKLRLNYNPPSPLLIVADGEWLITYDKELDETNYVSLENTPAEFILRPHITFGGDLDVISVIPQKDNSTAITLAKAGKYDEGQMTLVFENDPVRLKKWTVTDGQGVETHVVLSNLRLNQPVSDSLFKFNKPNLGEKLF